MNSEERKKTSTGGGHACSRRDKTQRERDGDKTF